VRALLVSCVGRARTGDSAPVGAESDRFHRPAEEAVDTGYSEFIVFQGIIKGKGLQALVQILYQILDKTRNVVYK